jgi:hypothetical protein
MQTTKLSTPTINTIVTMVVRMKEQVAVCAPGKKASFVVWDNMNAEPQVIEPGTTAIRHRGIVDVVAWLRDQPAESDYLVYNGTDVKA